MRTIAFLNNRSGDGKTALVYHLAWMFAELGRRVVAADLDTQSQLSGMFLGEARLEELWPDGDHSSTIQAALERNAQPHIEEITREIGLIVGDLGLSNFEDLPTDAVRVAMQAASEKWNADLVLVDAGPGLGYLNRSVLAAVDAVVIPIAADVFSAQALRALGHRLRVSTNCRPIGYVLMQPALRRAGRSWSDRIPGEYRRAVLDEDAVGPGALDDPNCLGSLKRYQSLMPMATEAHKPMFHLKPADGAIGAHGEAVRDCHAEFKRLAMRILTAM